MDSRSVILFLIVLSTTNARTGLRLLFPELQKQYVYVVKTNVSTGTLTPRESGTFWTLEGKLTVQVYDNYTKARLRLSGLKKTVCCKDHEQESNVVTEDELYITEPWELDYQDNGYISSIYVGQEPLWCTNLKRAISVNFQLTRNSGTYSVNEPCLDEVCLMMYTIRGNTIKKYTSFKVLAAGTERSWSSVPWAIDFTGKLFIDSVSTAERVYEMDDVQGLMSLDLKGSYQYKTHNHILVVTSDLSLYYETDKPAVTIEKVNLIQKSIKYEASNFTNPTNGIRELSQSLLKNRTYEILLAIALKGIDADNIVRDPALIHNLDFIDLLNTISRLQYESLVKLFEDLVLGTSYELETARNIFLEILPHARTETCARFIKYILLEEKEKVEDAAIVSLIRKLPFNLATHSQSLLEELEVFTKLGLDFPADIRFAGILSYATLINKAMVSGQVKQDYFDNIVVKYFRMYSDCPQYQDRMIWLQGLCNIGFSAESYLRIIYADSSRDRHERLWAALTGSPNTEEHYMILQSTLPILTNDTEYIQLRIIAVHMFLSSNNVRESDFLFVHNYIRNCENEQLKRFWYATVKNMEQNKFFTGYKISTFYVPFVANQISNPDPLYWATNNYIISSQEENSPSLQVLSIGDDQGAFPTFVGLKLATGGRRPYKADVYIIVEGVANSIYNKLFEYDHEELNVDNLVKVLKSIHSWRLKTPEKVHIDILIKLHGKTVFAIHMNQSRFESWNGEDLAASIEDFLRFGSHINQQIVYYPFQSDVHFPTELGTPIRLQSTILSFTSLRGNLTAPSSRELTWRNDLHIRYQGTSVTSLSTDGPLVQTLHSARIQQSLVAHLPMKFNVSFSSADRSLELTWPNPGAQEGGVAMHSRAQVAMEIMNDKYRRTVTVGGEHELKETGVFFDCEKPMSGAEVLDKLLSPKTHNLDFLTSIEPSMMVLNSIILFTRPPSGSCGMILPPRRLMRDGEDVLQVKFKVKHLSLVNDSNEVSLGFLFNYYSVNDPSDVFLKVDAEVKAVSTWKKTIIDLIVISQQDSGPRRKDWTFCLRNQEVSHATSDHTISPYPENYDGQISLAFTRNKTTCFEDHSGAELSLWYRGVPKIIQGKLERYFEIDIFGRNLSDMGMLDTEIGESAVGQFLQRYDQKPLNITTIIKEKDGIALISINKGPEIQFKSDNFAWVLDDWNDMKLLKKLGLYKECRLQETAVQTLSGTMEQLPQSTCNEYLVLADCISSKPRFAILRQKNGGIKVYTGGFYVLVTEESEDSLPKVDESNAGRQFWVTRIGHTVKVASYLTNIEVHYQTNETVILVPHFYASTLCGACSNVNEYLC